MAHLQYHSYKGFGTSKREELWYSQAVRIGNTIELAGQGKPKQIHLHPLTRPYISNHFPPNRRLGSPHQPHSPLTIHHLRNLARLRKRTALSP